MGFCPERFMPSQWNLRWVLNLGNFTVLEWADNDRKILSAGLRVPIKLRHFMVQKVRQAEVGFSVGYRCSKLI